MDLGLSGRHVVVTGASGALGGAVVSQLLEEGARVHAPCVESPGEVDLGGEVEVACEVDLRDEQQVAGYYRELSDLWASIHCAGGFAMKSFAETSASEHREIYDLNATTCVLCCREAVDAIRRAPHEGGRIVNVAAQTSLDPRRGAGLVAYTISKAAVSSLSVALGEELASEGLFVNAVAPSILDTPANRRAMPDADHDSWASVEDVARTIVFLASPANGASRSGVVPVFGRS